MVLDSTSGRLHPDLVACVVAGWLGRRRPAVVLMGAMWNHDAGLLGRIERVFVRLADRGIDLYAVQSTEELELFARSWGVDRGKLRFVPYFATITDTDASAPLAGEAADVFSGGDSHRDYEPLLAAALRLPQLRFVLATSTLAHRNDLPPNVTAGWMDRLAFYSALRQAKAVVVPIRRNLDRAAGQQTYLNAMLLGKPTIVTDSPGVRDHVTAGETGFVVDGSVESYVEALSSIFDPGRSSDIHAMGARAQSVVATSFTFERHAEAVLHVLGEAVSRRNAARTVGRRSR